MASGAFNNFGKVAKFLAEEAVPNIIAKVALDAEAGYKSKIISYSFHGTGNMLNSCFSITPKGTSYIDGTERDPLPVLTGKYQGFAGIAANYAIYQNYGTVFIPPRPFFEPVNEQMQMVFTKAVEAAMKSLEGFSE